MWFPSVHEPDFPITGEVAVPVGNRLDEIEKLWTGDDVVGDFLYGSHCGGRIGTSRGGAVSLRGGEGSSRV